MVLTLLSVHRWTSLYGLKFRYDGLLLTLTAFIFFYFSLLCFRSESSLQKLALFFYLSGLLVSVFGLLLYFRIFELSGLVLPAENRLTGTLTNPMFTGVFLGMVLLALPFVVKFLPLPFLLPSLLLILASFYLTFSRGAWLAFLFSLFISLFLFPKKRAYKVIIFIFLFLFLLAGLPRLKSLVQRKETHDRFAIYTVSMKMISENPLGTGPQTYHIYFPRFQPRDWAFREVEKGKTVENAHSQLLGISSEYGLFGLLFYLWFFIYYFLKVLKERSNPLYFAFFLSVFFYFLSIQFYFNDVSVTPIAWIFMGASLSPFVRLKKVKVNPSLVKAGLIIFVPIFAYGVYTSLLPIFSDYHLLKCAGYLEREMPEIAVEEGLKAVFLNENEEINHRFLSLSYLALAIKKNDPSYLKWAFQEVNKAVNKNPYAHLALLSRAEVHWKAGLIFNSKKELKKAKKFYKVALEFDDQFIQARIGVAKTSLLLGEEKEAERELKWLKKAWPQNGEVRKIEEFLSLYKD